MDIKTERDKDGWEEERGLATTILSTAVYHLIIIICQLSCMNEIGHTNHKTLK